MLFLAIKLFIQKIKAMTKLTTTEALSFFYSLSHSEQNQIIKDALVLDMTIIEMIETILHYDILDNA